MHPRDGSRDSAREFSGRYHAVSAGAGMPGRMTIWRIVATERGTACLTNPKMDPARTDSHAFLTHATAGVPDRRDLGQMTARFVRHQLLSSTGDDWEQRPSFFGIDPVGSACMLRSWTGHLPLRQSKRTPAPPTLSCAAAQTDFFRKSSAANTICGPMSPRAMAAAMPLRAPTITC